MEQFRLEIDRFSNEDWVSPSKLTKTTPIQTPFGVAIIQLMLK